MMEILGKNYFELFGLPVQFGIDLNTISERYRELQRLTHPDQFASASDEEQRSSVQHSAQVNDAYQTLKSPLKRAQYILGLRGAPLNDRDTEMDPLFLIQQMEIRESIEQIPESADPWMLLDKIRADLRHDIDHAMQLVSQRLDGEEDESDVEEAKDQVKKLQFLFKVQYELDEMEERLAGHV